MATIKGFNSKKFERELQIAVKRQVETELACHPDKFLKEHIGDVVEAKCQLCGYSQIQVVSCTEGKCLKCGNVEKIVLNLKWR